MAASPSTTAPIGEAVTWASLLDVAPANRMRFRPPEKINVGYRLPREVKKRGEERWKDCLIGQFVGALPKLGLLQQWANGLWGRDGPVVVSRFGPCLLVFQFPSAATSQWDFKSGPWHYHGNQIFFRKWAPGIEPVAPVIEILPIWVRIWGIPLEYHTLEGLEWVASTIGPPVWMDQTTRKGHQLEFAKVCVNLAADCGFQTKIRLYPDDDPAFDIEVEYLNKPMVCSKCEVYGHECNRGETVVKKWVPKSQVSVVQDKHDVDSQIVVATLNKGKEKVGVEQVVVNVDVGSAVAQVFLSGSGGIVEEGQVSGSGDFVEKVQDSGSGLVTSVGVAGGGGGAGC
ncbi:unnamed protein product [Linum trigynum]|uniref:DUF4283 domain-containing protein n=1 Tax=Linum trigynum TaxID=586398 RepID=A0AAV2CI28_9ROSI